MAHGTLRTLSVFVAWPGASLDRAGRALCRALERELAALPGSAGRPLSSVLIACAGAPAPAGIAALLASLARQLRIVPELEVTLELRAPVAAKRLADYRAAGITRLALRAGALDDAVEAALRAAATQFARTSIDLAFLRPGQTLAHWQAELDRAVQLGAGHVSIEEHDAVPAIDSDIAAAFCDLAQDRLTGFGMPPYEIAHFARPGHEARHLLHGARGGDYLGVGPGAVGRITLGRTCQASTQPGPPSAWLAAVEAGGEVTQRQVLTPEERLIELLGSGLRLRAGIERAWFEPLVGGTLETVLAAERLEPLIEDGFLCLDRTGLRLSARGWLLCESVLARLLA